jgi:peroxiredoxin Q/BCP
MRKARVLAPVLGVLLVMACRKADEERRNTEAESTKAATSGAKAAASAQPARQGLLEPGQPAPDIAATAHTGEAVKLSGFRGRPVVVYFYPKDDTPGCTVEAQELRDESAELQKHQVVVLGVSSDDNESHRAFASKYQLPFLLLPDPDHSIAAAFGVPVSSGRAKRVTFVIGKDGKVARVFPDVTPKGHAAEILQVVSSLQS